MAKTSPSQPRTPRVQKTKALEETLDTHRNEGVEQPAFIRPLENLNVGELRRVIAFAEARIRDREASEKAATREELQKLAQERGFSMTDLFGELAPHAPQSGGENLVRQENRSERPSKPGTGVRMGSCGAAGEECQNGSMLPRLKARRGIAF